MSSLNNGEWGTLHRTRPRESVPQLTNRRVLLPDAQKELDGVRQCDAVVLHGPGRLIPFVEIRLEDADPRRLTGATLDLSAPASGLQCYDTVVDNNTHSPGYSD